MSSWPVRPIPIPPRTPLLLPSAAITQPARTLDVRPVSRSVSFAVTPVPSCEHSPTSCS
jgi:hypothetical protein